MAWDVTVPDTYMLSPTSTTRQSHQVRQLTERRKISCANLCNTHLFYPTAIETAGTWHNMAIELTQKIGRRVDMVTELRHYGNNTFVPAALVRGSPEGECGLLPKYFTQ